MARGYGRRREAGAYVARRQRDLGLGLPAAEMDVVEIARDRLVERRQIGVDQQMMVAGIASGLPGGSDLHAADCEANDELAGDAVIIGEADEAELGDCRGRAALHRARLGRCLAGRKSHGKGTSQSRRYQDGDEARHPQRHRRLPSTRRIQRGYQRVLAPSSGTLGIDVAGVALFWSSAKSCASLMRGRGS